MQESGLTHTLSFGLTITEGCPENLLAANLESRRIRNEVNRRISVEEYAKVVEHAREVGLERLCLDESMLSGHPTIF